MLASSKIKWIGSIFLGGFLLVIALMGGNWGTSYAAVAGDCPTPYINDLDPSAVPAGSDTRTITISGGNFKTLDDTRVWLLGSDYNGLLTPISVLPDGISVNITDTLMVVPDLYIVRVVVSCPGTVPTIPTLPVWDEVSNPLPFTVYEPRFTYLSFIAK